MSDEYRRCSMTSHSICTNFYWVCKEMWGLILSWWETALFQLANSICFSLIVAFNQFILEWYLSEFNIWFLQKELVMHNVLLILPDTVLLLDADQLLEWLMVAHFISPWIFSLKIVVNNTLFITCNFSFQKWSDFIMFEQIIENGNTLHSFFH